MKYLIYVCPVCGEDCGNDDGEYGFNHDPVYAHGLAYDKSLEPVEVEVEYDPSEIIEAAKERVEELRREKAEKDAKAKAEAERWAALSEEERDKEIMSWSPERRALKRLTDSMVIDIYERSNLRRQVFGGEA